MIRNLNESLLDKIKSNKNKEDIYKLLKEEY